MKYIKFFILFILLSINLTYSQENKTCIVCSKFDPAPPCKFYSVHKAIEEGYNIIKIASYEDNLVNTYIEPPWILNKAKKYVITRWEYSQSKKKPTIRFVLPSIKNKNIYKAIIAKSECTIKDLIIVFNEAYNIKEPVELVGIEIEKPSKLINLDIYNWEKKFKNKYLGTAIKIKEVKGLVRIFNSTIHNNLNGIELCNSKIEIKDCKITNNILNGIILNGNGDVTIKDSLIYNNKKTGIKIEQRSKKFKLRIENSEIIRNSTGLGVKKGAGELKIILKGVNLEENEEYGIKITGNKDEKEPELELIKVNFRNNKRDYYNAWKIK